MARILCILGLLLFVSCTVENMEIEEGIENLQLQQDGFGLLSELPENLKLTQKQDLIHMINEVSKSENAILYEDLDDTAQQEKGRRDVRSGLTTKRPCRTFFWKSWAAC